MDASRSSGAAPARAEAGINAEFRPLIDAIAQGVCVLDDRALITMCNRTFLEITGYEERAAAGRNVCELLHSASGESGGAPHSCELPKNGHQLRERAIVREYLMRKDGSRFPARCWLRPWRNAGLHHLLTVEDISELEQTKEVLDRSEQRFRQILKNAPDVAWTSDLQGHTLYISPKVEAVLGYSKEEFCSGQQLRLGRIHPADFGRVYEAYQSLFKNQTSLDIEYRFRHKNGKWI
jgi:PAS domain S-box-containing protein